MKLHFARRLTTEPIDPSLQSGNGLRAAIYCRTSSLEQTIESQRDECFRYCQRHGYRLVREYIEEGQSGNGPYLGPDSETFPSDLNARPLFKLMLLEAVLYRPFEILVVWHPDRFSRMHGPETLRVIDALRFHGVRIESVCRQEEIEGVTLKRSIVEGIDSDAGAA